jgi:alkylation response protein AidB-like acyl-CoA dehydrogenase
VLGAAAQRVGLARRMIDMTVEYSGQRYQFGAPIGSFQAVKHHLADARIALEFARPLVYRGAWALSHDDPLASMHASMAKATASDAAMLASRKALQCHGAMGYSYEYDLHLFAKRAWALAADWGDATWHRSRVGGVIL